MSKGQIGDERRDEIVVETALRQGRSQQDAYAPIYYLSSKFDGLFLPPVPRTIETSDYSKQLCRTIKESGEAFVAAAAALEDDNLTPNERRKILKETYEALAELSAFARMIEESA